jgi:N-acetylglucosaminyldiphosphoundecaprenol N-acetyl-beta-D-mannosaminyltransferase
MSHAASIAARAEPARRTPSGPAAAPAHEQVRIGDAWIDAVTFPEALGAVAALVDAGAGGVVVTPNVDHIVRLAGDEAFREVYRRADLVLADGMPVLWAARLLGTPLPEKVSGSDFVMPVARLAAQRGWRVYLLGGAPGAAVAAAARMLDEAGLRVGGIDVPLVSTEGDEAAERAIVERVVAARPDLVLVAFGAPKQERLCARIRDRVRPAVLLCVGVSLSFVAGHVRRAPAWISRLGLEWVHRLLQEPRRLWRRYLVEDPKFLAIVWRTSRLPRSARVRRVRAAER